MLPVNLTPFSAGCWGRSNLCNLFISAYLFSLNKKISIELSNAQPMSTCGFPIRLLLSLISKSWQLRANSRRGPFANMSPTTREMRSPNTSRVVSCHYRHPHRLPSTNCCQIRIPTTTQPVKLFAEFHQSLMSTQPPYQHFILYLAVCGSLLLCTSLSLSKKKDSINKRRGSWKGNIFIDGGCNLIYQSHRQTDPIPTFILQEMEIKDGIEELIKGHLKQLINIYK